MFRRPATTGPLAEKSAHNTNIYFVNVIVQSSRASVHPHVVIVVPIMAISDDKKHDTFFVQVFLKNHLFGERGWFETQVDFPGLYERLENFFINSDGAASHFKQRLMLFFLLYLANTYTHLQFSWMVGCPGHGKNAHDGFGGILKNKVIRYVANHEVVCSNAWDVFNLVCVLFSSDIKREEFRGRKDVKIKVWHICYVAASETDAIRPKENEEDITTYLFGFKQISDRGLGTRAIFFFKADRPNRLQYRILGCCCSSTCNDSLQVETSTCQFIGQHFWDSQTVTSERRALVAEGDESAAVAGRGAVGAGAARGEADASAGDGAGNVGVRLGGGFVVENIREAERAMVVDEGVDPWVQCVFCQKWRHWGSDEKLPEEDVDWKCEENTWDQFNSCDIAEQLNLPWTI